MRAGLALGLLLLAACAPEPRPPPVVMDDCAVACSHARALGCVEGATSPDGASCEAVCRNADAHGIDIGTACMRAASDCTALSRCTAR